MWVRNFCSPHKVTFCNKKSPKTEVFGDFWSCYPDSNWGPHPYQAPPELFSNYFLCFMALSAPIRLHSATLWTQGFRLFRNCLWRVVWSNRWAVGLAIWQFAQMWSNHVFGAVAVIHRPTFSAIHHETAFAMVLTMISAIENILILITRLRYAHFCIKNLVSKFIQVRSKSIYTILPSKSWEFSRKIWKICFTYYIH